MSRGYLLLVAAVSLAAVTAGDLERARDKQDRAALTGMAAQLQAESQKKPKDSAALYSYALAQSYLAEVAIEVKDKNQAKNAAEAGITAAQKLVAMQPNNAEYHRILGTLCGQIVPANVLLALKYGKCAQDSINKAVELDPKSAPAYLSRGVGNYYLPPQFGGGPDQAVKDFEKAIQLNSKLADAWMWLGVSQRKLNRNAEARKSLQRAVELNPDRVWAKQQLEKTPAR
jgi:tetratricopeptide (TPR) repeat protein